MTTDTYPHPSRVTATGPHHVTGLLPKCSSYFCVLAENHAGEHLEPAYHSYWARDGKVLAEDLETGEYREVAAPLPGTEYGRAREKYEEAAAEADRQRAAATKAAKVAAGMNPRIHAVGSHHLELDRYGRAPIVRKEELHPVVELEAPRAGAVRAEFSADRYVANDATLGDVMGEWRIVLRDVRTVPDEGSTYGKLANGIGPAARQAINAAGEPLILEWLESGHYKRSRRLAAAHAVRRTITEAGTRSYNVDNARQTLEAAGGELAPLELSHLKQTLELVAQVAANLDREPIA